MNSNTSDIWTMPPWISMASITGPHPTLIPEGYSGTNSKPRPATNRPTRPDTLRLVPSTAAVGVTRWASPPPDLARVASSVALLGALLVSLGLSWALGG